MTKDEVCAALALMLGQDASLAFEFRAARKLVAEGLGLGHCLNEHGTLDLFDCPLPTRGEYNRWFKAQYDQG